MRRFTSLLFLFLLLSSLAVVAAPVRAGTVSYYGVRFDGATSYVEISNSTSLDSITTAFTAIVIAVSYNNSASPNLFSRSFNAGWRARINAGTNVSWFLVSNGSTYQILTGTTPILQGVTYMFAFSVSVGGDMKIYVNGKLDASAPYTLNKIGGVGNPLYLGIARTISTLERLDGTIYYFILYNRQLTDTEIQQIYNDPMNPPTTGLVLEYLPSSVDTATNTWDDLSGNGNDGSIVNATYVPLRPISEALQSGASALKFSATYEDINASLYFRDFSVVAIVKPDIVYSSTLGMMIANAWGTGGNAWWLALRSQNRVVLGLYDYENAVYTQTWASMGVNANETAMIVAIKNGTISKIFINTKLVGSSSTNSDVEYGGERTRIGMYSGGNLWDFYGSIYLVLIYSRALNSTEIREIYEHPLDPPKQGLVLFYSPCSYDPETGKWLNIAPIFSTLNLSEELDATNYGAVPERVSIPDAHYLDIENNSEIPIENVSVALLSNNTTISLIPSFLTLPYNSTVTLNVSAVGYLPHLFSLPGSTNDLTVFLTPNNQTTLTLPSVNITNYVQNFTENNFTITPINPYAKALLDSGGSFGDTVKLAIKGDELVKILLPQLTIFAIVIIVFWQSQSPLAALAGALITWGMWQAVLGEAPNLRNSGVTFALVVFLVAWTLWDLFYNYARET